MVDKSNLFSGQITDDFGNPDFFNTSYILVSLFVLGSIGFSGLRQGQLPTIILSVVYLIFFVIGLVATRGDLIKGESSIFEGAGGYLIGILVTSLLINPFDFSFLSTPGSSFLSSVLAQTAPIKADIANKFLAGLENLLILPVASISYFFVDEAGLFDSDKFLKLSVASLPAVVGFAVLHGTGRSFTFFLLAGSIAYLWILSVGYEDITKEKVLPFIVGTIGFTVGSHHAFNSGGLLGIVFGFWSDLFAALNQGTVGAETVFGIVGWQAMVMLLGGYWLVREIGSMSGGDLI